jgi:hypothetical protein
VARRLIDGQAAYNACHHLASRLGKLEANLKLREKAVEEREVATALAETRVEGRIQEVVKIHKVEMREYEGKVTETLHKKGYVQLEYGGGTVGTVGMESGEWGERDRVEKEKKERVAAEAKRQKEEEKKEKKRQEEHAARMNLANKTAFDDEFTTNTGRVKVDKQIRKAKQRKDSLDDHSDNSSSEEEAPRRRGRQTKAEEQEAE